MLQSPSLEVLISSFQCMSKVNRSRAVNQWRHSVQHTAAKGKTVDTFAFVEMRGEESVENPCCDDDRSFEVDSIDAATEEATTSLNGSKIIISKPEFWKMTVKSVNTCGL